MERRNGADDRRQFRQRGRGEGVDRRGRRCQCRRTRQGTECADVGRRRGPRGCRQDADRRRGGREGRLEERIHSARLRGREERLQVRGEPGCGGRRPELRLARRDQGPVGGGCEQERSRGGCVGGSGRRSERRGPRGLHAPAHGRAKWQPRSDEQVVGEGREPERPNATRSRGLGAVAAEEHSAFRQANKRLS